MDRTFQKFLRSGLDLAPLGVERREENLPYFCTPKGAAIFGWAGVDGIHYCFIRGFGGMVFAVSPMNAAPDCVHPLARDFADFLRLLLACGEWIRQEGLPLTVTACLLFRPEAWLKSRLRAAGDTEIGLRAGG